LSRRNKPSISFRVSAEEKALVEHWARRNGTTVSEFLRDAVTHAIPMDERRKFANQWQLGESLGVVEAEADAAAGLLPEAIEDEPEDESGVTALHMPRDHTCAHLDDTSYPKFFSGATCYGTCDHRVQRGRPCFWPSQTAHQCDHFRPVRTPKRS